MLKIVECNLQIICATPYHSLTRYKVVIAYILLHTKFQIHQFIGSGEDFLRFYMGMAAMLVTAF